MPHRIPLSTLKKLFRSSPGRRQPILGRARRTASPFWSYWKIAACSANTVTNTSYSGTGSLGAAIAAAVDASDSDCRDHLQLARINSTIQLSASDVSPAAAEYGPTAFFINGGSGTTNITIDGSGAPGW